MKLTCVLLSALLAPAVARSAQVGRIPPGPLTLNMVGAIAAQVAMFDHPDRAPEEFAQVFAALKHHRIDQATEESYDPVVLGLLISFERLMVRCDKAVQDVGLVPQAQLIDLSLKLKLVQDLTLQFDPGAPELEKIKGYLQELQRGLAEKNWAKLKARMEKMAAALNEGGKDAAAVDADPALGRKADLKEGKLKPAAAKAIAPSLPPAPSDRYTTKADGVVVVENNLIPEIQAAIERMIARRAGDLANINGFAAITFMRYSFAAREAMFNIRSTDRLSEAVALLKRRRGDWTRWIPGLGGKVDPMKMNLDKQLDAVVDLAVLIANGK